MSIQIQTSGTRVSVAAPYNPSFAPKAKRLGGKWDPGSKVRDLCMELYGEDGRAPAELCTLRVVFDELDSRTCEVRICGRQVARVLGRDSGARLGEGVVVESGRFASSGSMKNPAIVGSHGVTVLVRDLPRAIVERAFESGDWGTSAVRSVECVVEGEAAAVEALASAPNAEELAAELDAALLGVAVAAEAAEQASEVTGDLRRALAVWRRAAAAVVAAGGAK